MSASVSVSVIVPVRNGGQFVQPFCEAMRKQMCNDYELILVDNGSTDETSRLLQGQGGLPFRVIEWHDAVSSYGARNAGVQSSSAELLAFTDIDCQPQPDWIENMIAQKDSVLQGSILAGGICLFLPQAHADTDPSYGASVLTEEDEVEAGLWNPVAAYDRRVHLQQQRYVQRSTAATANMIVSRRVFERVGGFDPVISGDDHAFCQRASRVGATIVFCPEICVRHPLRTSLREALAKEWRIGKGKGMRMASCRTSSFALSLIKTLLALFVQPMQWRLVMQAFRAGQLRYGQALSLATVALCCGYVGRVSILLHALGGRMFGGLRSG